MAYIGSTPANKIVTASDMEDGVVSTDKLAANAVVTSKITDGTIATADVANDAVTLAKMAAGTDGNIISYDASGNPVAVATGSDGQVLTSTGAGSPPAFEAAAAGGKVLQVVTYTDNTSRSSTSSSFVTASSTLGGAITPSASNSKILAMVHFNGSVPQASTQNTYTIYRGSTNLGDGTNGMAMINPGGGTHDTGSVVTMMYLDSPNTTSATTYQVRGKRSASTFYINYGSSLVSLILMEIGA
tara:strand:+ start:48 stop:776 length:729 start_codon:yes stop_codon:yes gene_type:complete